MKRPASAFARLLREPQAFRFDAALRVLMRKAQVSDPATAARFVADPSLAFPGSEITAVQQARDGRPPRVRVALIGLTGAAGVLPKLYGTLAAGASRRGSAALQDFLDLLSHRMVAFFGAAGSKYRLHRTEERAAQADPPGASPIADTLLALTGFATPGLVDRLPGGADPLLHYAGLFAAHPRSADRLGAMLSDWLGQPVEVRQFVSAWLPLPRDQQTALPVGGLGGAWNRLGEDAAIGVRSWDLQGRVVLRIGPLDRNSFEALLPGRPVFVRLAALARAFLGPEIGFAVNPVLAREQGFQPKLDGRTSLLGWNTWLASVDGRLRTDAADAVLEPPWR